MARKTTTPISIGLNHRQIFVDTGGWISVECKGDKYHSAGSSYYSDLLRSDAQLLTSDYVLDETITRLKYDVGFDIAEECWMRVKEAERSGRLIVLDVDGTVRDAAFEILRKYHDQKISFTDCASFVLAQREKVEAVFAFDHHFRLFGLIMEPVP